MSLAVPREGERNVLITSALPYVNNVPHLGNIIGCVLSADVYARFCRLRGYNTLYICGTDEYGTATETKAIEEKCTPKEICDKFHAKHKAIYDWFNISFDHFGRTSTPQQTEIAQNIFTKIWENGYMIEDTIEQLFCKVDEMYLADRFVVGTCPSCGYEEATGDQCDKCGKLFDSPKELVDPKCKICGKTDLEVRHPEHIFIDLPELKDKLEDFVDHQSEKWSSHALQMTRGWLRDGLQRRCITRDLKWGTPVPLERYKDKVFYVWFDAPIGYISITAAALEGKDWSQWWQNPENVELVQFMGKDNVPFHSVIFPSSLLATKENWTMVNNLSITEYLNYEDGKFSKSRGIGVFGDNAQDTGIPSEVWRYYLLVQRPEMSDTTFTWEDFQTKNNNELLNNLGNFINRVLSFTSKFFDGKIPSGSEESLDEKDHNLIQDVNTHLTQYIEALEQIRIKEGLKLCMTISKLGNQYMQENKPWELAKNDMPRCAKVINLGAQIVYLLSTLLSPYMPSLSTKILDQMNMKPQTFIPETLEFSVPSGHPIGTPAPLFKKIDNKTVKALRAKYSGKQGEDKEAADDSQNGGKKKKKQNQKKKKKLEGFYLDLRIGKVISVENHPEADKLYLLKVDLGEENPRTVVAGLKKFYPSPEEGGDESTTLLHRKVVAVANLKAAKLKGIKSEAMLLAASKDENTVRLVQPDDSDVPVGTRVAPEGIPVTEASNIDRKGFQAIKMSTGEGGKATYRVKKEAYDLVATVEGRDTPVPVRADIDGEGHVVR
eukprot:gb/GECH01013007.1/.p1 GENE.gb/GECH01013007.1/~~gb/GECH01013007.1/.p1  ORF type:complete len:775 (+),score=156.05 gb/GECH01013007.1/:1-2325(+)